MSERLSTSCDDQQNAMMRRRIPPVVSLGVLVATATVVLLFVVIPKLSPNLRYFYNQDLYSDGYDQLAANLAAGNGYRFYPDTAQTLMREPGYPVLLAGIFIVFGKSFTTVKLVNVALAFAAAWLMTRVARRLSSSQALILVPPLLFLFHPGTLIAESRGGVEVPFTFLIVLFMVTLYRALDRDRWSDYVISGVALGLAVSVKSTPMLFPFFLLAYLLVVERGRGRRLAVSRNVALMVVAMFVVLLPWTIRNYRLTKRFVPTASVLGVSAHAGQYICLHHDEERPWVLLDREAAIERGQLARELGYRFKEGDPYYQVFYSTEDEMNFSHDLVKRVRDEYLESPWLCVRCITYNLFNFWCAGKTWASTSMSVIVQLPYLLLGMAGAVLSVKRGHAKVIGPMVLLVLYMVAVHAPILAQARYSIPLIPFLSILASVALLAAGRRVVRLCAADAIPYGEDNR